MPQSHRPNVIEIGCQGQLALDGLGAMEVMPRGDKTGANADLHLVAYQDRHREQHPGFPLDPSNRRGDGERDAGEQQRPAQDGSEDAQEVVIIEGKVGHGQKNPPGGAGDVDLAARSIESMGLTVKPYLRTVGGND